MSDVALLLMYVGRLALEQRKRKREEKRELLRTKQQVLLASRHLANQKDENVHSSPALGSYEFHFLFSFFFRPDVRNGYKK